MDANLIHDSHSKNYRSVFGAVKTGTEVTLSIIGNNIQEAYLELVHFDGSYESIKMTKKNEECHCLCYIANITLNSSGTIYYHFKLNIYNKIVYYGNNRERLGGEGTIYDSDPIPYQITVYKDYKTPSWFKEGIIYQIFVDRFFNGNEDGKVNNPKKDSFIYGNWHDEPMYIKDEQGKVVRWDFFGGNLDGVIKKLPYIASLGVNIIYFNPIFEAVSNHKYDTGDYEKIDPMFGDEKKFKELCKKAKDMGIKIVLDGVFSHTGEDSKYFNKFGSYNTVGAYQSKDSNYFNWYRFIDYPNKYDCWWGFDNLPNIEELNSDYMNYIIKSKNSIIQKWMEAGASGWRLDVADELPDEFIRELKLKMREINKESVLIGEVWEDASNKVSYGMKRKYFFGDELDCVTNYPLRSLILDFIRGYINSSEFNRKYKSLYENYPKEAFYSTMNLLSNHDTERMLTMFEGLDKMKAFKLATALQMTLPGVPLIYYGDEAGVDGGKDPYNRKTYPWGKENVELLTWYRKLSSIRVKNNAIKKGDINLYKVSSNVIAFSRKYDREVIITIINRSESIQKVELAVEGRLFTDLLSNEKFATTTYGLLTVNIDPKSVIILSNK